MLASNLSWVPVGHSILIILFFTPPFQKVPLEDAEDFISSSLPTASRELSEAAAMGQTTLVETWQTDRANLAWHLTLTPTFLDPLDPVHSVQSKTNNVKPPEFSHHSLREDGPSEKPRHALCT